MIMSLLSVRPTLHNPICDSESSAGNCEEPLHFLTVGDLQAGKEVDPTDLSHVKDARFSGWLGIQVMRKWTNRSPDQVSSTFLRSFRSDDVSHSFLGWGYDGRVGPYLGGIIGNRTLRLHSFSRDLAPRPHANFNVYGCIEEVSTLR